MGKENLLIPPGMLTLNNDEGTYTHFRSHTNAPKIQEKGKEKTALSFPPFYPVMYIFPAPGKKEQEVRPVI